MTDVVGLVRDGFALAIELVVPVAVGAGLGGFTGASLAALAGVPDQSLALLGRAIGVLVALWIVGAGSGESLRKFAESSWSTLPTVQSAGLVP